MTKKRQAVKNNQMHSFLPNAIIPPHYVFGIMVLAFIGTTFLYCHPQINLSSPWILDDKGTITMNPVVADLKVPWSEVWTRDFWGQHQLQDERSHKSWRPLCTATYRLQRMYFQLAAGEKTALVGEAELASQA